MVEEELLLLPRSQLQITPFPGLGSLLTPGAALPSAGLASALESRFIPPRFRGGERFLLCAPLSCPSWETFSRGRKSELPPPRSFLLS